MRIVNNDSNGVKSDKDIILSFKDINLNDSVELYTIQSLEQIQNLNKNGYMTGDPDKICCPEFDEAYDWMKDKMTEDYNLVVPSHFNNKDRVSPVWFWYSFGGQHKRRPDLRYSGYAERGTKLGLVTFKKSWSDILISDFEMWHAVLNKSLLDHNDEFRRLSEVLDSNKPYKFYDELSVDTQSSITKSWDIIFDMTFEDPDFTEPFKDKRLQGTTWQIITDEVQNIKYFVAR